MSIRVCIRVAALSVAMGYAAAASAISIPTVPIGNPGNAGDARVMNDGTTGHGSVGYVYNIGTTEVTNTQYAAFLNAVASDDTYGLYNPSMAGPFCGITRGGVSGAYSYAVTEGREANPVTYVSSWDAARFANWLHNGQPTGEQNAGTTEDGAYTLTPDGISENTIARNAGWRWAVTSEDEWYKAAYHQPAGAGGSPTNYWRFPTSSDSIPTSSDANFGGIVGNTMPAGSYGPNYYGVFDIAGNVWEVTDTIARGLYRPMRGGSMFSPGAFAAADDRNTTNAANEGADDGFRVVNVPAPASTALMAFGLIGALARRRVK